MGVAACHAAVDGVALQVLRREFDVLLGGGTLLPLSSYTPLQIAAMEQSPASRRRAAASLRHWEFVLRHTPQAAFAEPRTAPSDQMLPRMWMRSASGLDDLRRVAARTRLSESMVLLAAWCALVAHRTGQRTCATTVLSSNRSVPRLAEYVGTIAQDALLAFELSGDTFDDLLQRTWRSAMVAYRHSSYDASALWGVIERTERDRGTTFTRDIVFNDLGNFAPSSRDWENPCVEPAFAWDAPEPTPGRLTLWRYASSGALELAMRVDPQMLDRREAEAFTRGMLALLRAAADGPVPMCELAAVTGVRPPIRGDGWLQIDGCWVDLAAVERLLRSALGDVPVSVTAPDDAPQGRQLIARIAVPDAAMTPERVHERVMRALAGNETAMAPQQYVLHLLAPGGEVAQADWSAYPVFAQGRGRE